AKFWTAEPKPAASIERLIGARPPQLKRRRLELETRGESSLRDLELLRGRLRRRQAVLELVAGPGESLGEPMLGVSLHPAEELGRSGERTDGRRHARRRAQGCGGARSEDIARGRGREQWANEVGAAAFVLLLARLVVLVAS